MSGSMFDRMLRINVGTRTASVWAVPEDVRAYLGGIGYGVKILSDEVNPEVDPLSSENKVVLSVGPLTGTSAPMHAQTCLVTKSPLTGTVLNSYAGGFLGAEIKFCGLDGFILEGAGSEWSILLIDDDHARFESADAIPTDDLPATTVPWIITISGILAIAAGVSLFMPGRVWGILAAVLGAALLITTFALNLPQKAADADELNDNLKPIYTQELIDGAEGSLVVVAAMGEEMQTKMLPDLAAALGMSPDELNAFMGQNFPATAAAMQTMPESLERFEAFVGIFAANLDNYETIQPVSFTPIIWMMVIGGILMVLAGGYCIIFR